jgi:23S rRNA (guanosine2251-2'-O)-methyltransferase
VSLYEADLKKPLLLIIGGEKRGISRTLIDLSNEIVRIDYGRKFMGSLTTASSAAVIAFEIMRRNT